MLRMMIDLETLSVAPNPVILSIGVAVFDTDTIVHAEQIDVDPSSCQRAGLVIDSSTVLWWMNQSAEAQAATLGVIARVPLQEALSKVAKIYTDFACGEVWSNGALADIVWMNNAYVAVGSRAPWSYRAERCFRTAKALLPEVDVVFDGIPHRAVDDAIHQARYLMLAAHCL